MFLENGGLQSKLSNITKGRNIAFSNNNLAQIAEIQAIHCLLPCSVVAVFTQWLVSESCVNEKFVHLLRSLVILINVLINYLLRQMRASLIEFN